jgi:hypothetical protein
LHSSSLRHFPASLTLHVPTSWLHLESFSILHRPQIKEDHFAEWSQKVVSLIELPAGAQHAAALTVRHMFEEGKEEEEKRAKEKKEKGKRKERKRERKGPGRRKRRVRKGKGDEEKE